ncbi:MAG: sensor histidine kinase [Chloroflexota bacterium]
MDGRLWFDATYLVLTGVVVGLLALQARRVGGWHWAFPLIFLLPTVQAGYRVITSLHTLGFVAAGAAPQVAPLVDRAMSTLFFILLVYAFLRPLLPRYKNPLSWLLVNNLVVLAGLVTIVSYDYALHWSPGMRFSQHWGPLAFEAYQIPLLLLAGGVLAYVWRESKSRYAALGAWAFGLWTVSHVLHAANLLAGRDDPFVNNPLQWGLEVGALLFLAFSVGLPDPKGRSFGERYAADAGAVVRRLQRQLQELTTAKAALEERERLARELHDSIAQGLFSIKMNAGAATAALEKDPDRARERLARLQEIANTTHQELRSLIEELRPPALTELGLQTTLQAHAAALKAQWGTDVILLVDEEGRLPADEEAELYRIAYEALNNAARHGHATRVEVLLQVTPPFFDLVITDNGVGFDAKATPRAGAFGLRGMRERAALIGAELKVVSTPGGGTRIEARRPGRPEER